MTERANGNGREPARRSGFTIGLLGAVGGVLSTIVVGAFTFGSTYTAMQQAIKLANDGILRHDDQFKLVATQLATMNETLRGEQRYADSILSLQKQIVDLTTNINGNANRITAVGDQLSQLREVHGSFVSGTNEHFRFMDETIARMQREDARKRVP